MTRRHAFLTRDLPALLAAAVLAAILGAAVVEAGPREKSRSRTSQERVEKKRKETKVRKDGDRREVRRKDSGDRVHRDRREDSHRKPKVERSHRDDDRHRVERGGKPEVRRPGHVIRGPSGHPRVHHPPRHPSRHRERIVHRWPRARTLCTPIRTLWWDRAPRLYVADRPYFFHATLGFYLGGLALRFDIGDIPPRGYYYYDPYCGRWYPTLTSFRDHGYDHEVVLTLVPVHACLDGGYVADRSWERYEDWEVRLYLEDWN